MKLKCLYLHDTLFELLVGDDGPVLDPGLVGIDGIDGIFKDAGYLFGVVDAHTDERKDPEVCIEEFVIF